VQIVAARYYPEIVDPLIEGARAAIAAAGATSAVVEVAGALEIPGAIAAIHRVHAFDGYVALGCVIRGETSHYDTVCNESARAIMDLTVDGVPIGNGILTVENEGQAQARAVAGGRNKGQEAAYAVLGMIALMRHLGSAAE
jgi:6,7-dimethyl-8-ribityllumazine synthase